jgi:hypothetical protein
VHCAFIYNASLERSVTDKITKAATRHVTKPFTPTIRQDDPDYIRKSAHNSVSKQFLTHIDHFLFSVPVIKGKKSACGYDHPEIDGSTTGLPDTIFRS